MMIFCFQIRFFCKKSDNKCNLSLQIFGPESSGKTTLALHAIAEVQVLICPGFSSVNFNFGVESPRACLYMS